MEDTLPYHVVHRIGSLPDAHGIFAYVMDWCFAHDPNIRIDTHHDNSIMRHCIEKYGISYCGIIYLLGGTVERTYDERNRLVFETNDLLRPRSIQTVYDSLDRVVQRRVVDASLLQVCQLYSAEYFPFPSVSGVLTGFIADSGVTEATDVDTVNVRGMLKSETFYSSPSSDGTAPSGGITRTRNYYYDYRGRTVQVSETDSDGWTARYSTKFDFAGNVIATKETHIAPGHDAEQHTILTTNAYDSRGRLTAIVRELDGQSLRPVYYIYDELGRVSRRIIGDGPDNTGYVAFNYDIHGWVTGIEARDNLGEDLVFREVLSYASTQKPGTDARWDGNIAEASFTNTDGSHTYAYTYDGIQRLTDAKHYAGASNTATNARTERSLSYDRNGNITALTRYDEAGTGTPLSFAFTGNRIAADTYDAMGNLTRNSRNGLEFSYNLANLPESVEGADGASLTYSYLSDGSKWRASANSGPSILYRGSFVYEDDGNSSRISSIAWGEGRISYDEEGDYCDEWYVQDHLGSVRAIVRMDDSGGTILEQNEYLPFGTRIPGSIQAADNRHRFGGKEEQRYGIDAATGTPAIDLGLLDFGARYYDPFTCRWTTRDPLAGKYYSLSPYNYCGGNPVNMVDAFGADLYIFDEEGTFQTKIQMEGEHRLVVNTKDNRGNITATFYDFADTVNDPADIDRGAINHIEFVSEKTILDIISGQDGFNANMLNFGFRSRGGHKYDYSYEVLQYKYPSGNSPGRNSILFSNYLFIPEGDKTAHNLMNFGNYLWGATGQVAGFGLGELKIGANVNSLLNPRSNGYKPQLDSKDDQRSIKQGYLHAKKNNYRNKR